MRTSCWGARAGTAGSSRRSPRRSRRHRSGRSRPGPRATAPGPERPGRRRRSTRPTRRSPTRAPSTGGVGTRGPPPPRTASRRTGRAATPALLAVSQPRHPLFLGNPASILPYLLPSSGPRGSRGARSSSAVRAFRHGMEGAPVPKPPPQRGRWRVPKPRVLARRSRTETRPQNNVPKTPPGEGRCRYRPFSGRYY